MSAHESRIIVALDYSDVTQAHALVRQLDPALCKLKVGKELFTSAGPTFVKELITEGYDVFLDLKFHDIPNTVAKACQSAAELGVWMLNVHALGGKKMLQAARAALPSRTTKLVAVTVLTSMNQDDLNDIGLHGDPQKIVNQLAQLAYDCNLDGVVCSAQEAQSLRNLLGNEFCLVTPGIRPAHSQANDQERITTPSKAIQNGANYLVIGRPITQSANPLQALQEISLEISRSSN